MAASVIQNGRPLGSHDPGRAYAGSPQAVALEWVLTGGEDHALVAAFPPGTALPARWRVIGEVREGTGVTVDGAPHEGPPAGSTSPDPTASADRPRVPTASAHHPGSMIMQG